MIPTPIDTLPFDTLDQAAVAAEQACEKISFDSGYEFGGVLLERDGKYYYTIASTSKDPTHFEIRAAFPSTYKLAGLYHTHPGTDADSRWFSPEDVRVAGVLRVPSYIGVQFENGAVRRFTTGMHTEIEPNANYYKHGRIALGEIVKVQS
jgi:proteasome lid subunit RPN8/RPN11